MRTVISSRTISSPGLGRGVRAVVPTLIIIKRHFSTVSVTIFM